MNVLLLQNILTYSTFSYIDTITFLSLLFFCSGMCLGMKHYREICLHVVLKYALCPQDRYELCNLN